MNSVLLVRNPDAEVFVASDKAHWSRAWAGLGIEPAPGRIYEELLTRYQEAHRAYHTREHLEECLLLLDEVWNECNHPEEMAIALWFHDAIYEPHRSDNEVASGRWLASVCYAMGVEELSIFRMRALVMATRHMAPVDQSDARMLVDIDLSILGASTERFDLYEAQIRREYRWVPGPLYRRKRAEVLRSFLRRPIIYTTPSFHDRFEQRARTNIARSLSRLER
jgi:predicted metal-dependent HD superfamily phosphohydrolase